MRVLLRNVLTQLYFAESGEWVEDGAQARDFEKTIAALRFGQSLGSKHMEIVFSFGASQFDLAIPLETTLRESQQLPAAEQPPVQQG